MKTEIFKEEDVLRDPGPVARILKDGGIVVFPTDTVYGLGVHPWCLNAIDSIYALKGRDMLKALPLLASDEEAALKIVSDVTSEARLLMETFWPGPLTLVLPALENGVPEVIRAGGSMVGVRVPDRESVRAIAGAAGGILASSSANLTGAPESVRFEEARRTFDHLVNVMVDGGECPGGVPSTVVACTPQNVSILREGAIKVFAIADCLNRQL